MNSKPVRIVSRRCDDYAFADRIVGEMLDRLGADRILAGQKVLVKVNLMLGGPADQGTNTHPAVAAGLVHYIRDHGGEADVADSSGALGLTDACFVRSGIIEAVKKAGGRCINLDSVPMRKAAINGQVIKELVLPACLDDYQVIVSAAKFKVHPLTTMTGAVKNMMGIAPGAVKPAIHHRFARTPHKLGEALIDLYTAFTPGLSLVDGIIGREGGGSTDGSAVSTNVLCAAYDGLALDGFCTRLMGFSTEDVPTLVSGAKQKAGVVDPSYWEIEDDGPTDFGACALRPAPRDKKANPLMAFVAYFLRDHAVRPVFPAKGCESCDECISSCPVDALRVRNGKVIRSHRRCVGCYCCVYACEKGLAKLSVKMYAKKMFWQKATGLETDRFV